MKNIKLTIKQGKFYRGSELVPVEFGNEEQIACLKEVEQKETQLNDEELGFELSVDYEEKVTASTSFKCNCGSNVYFEAEADNENDAFDDLKDRKKTCHNCKKAYITFKNEDEELAIKYIK